MKELICKAFCESVKVVDLPNGSGFGISSSMFEAHGDPVGIYAIPNRTNGKWRIDDSGWVAPMLSASGYDLSSTSRMQVFEEILERSGIKFDHDTFEIFADGIPEKEVPATAIRFFSALSKVAELGGWTQERVKSTFRDDVTASLRSILPGVTITENAPLIQGSVTWWPILSCRRRASGLSRYILHKLRFLCLRRCSLGQRLPICITGQK